MTGIRKYTLNITYIHIMSIHNIFVGGILEKLYKFSKVVVKYKYINKHFKKNAVSLIKLS